MLSYVLFALRKIPSKFKVIPTFKIFHIIYIIGHTRTVYKHDVIPAIQLNGINQKFFCDLQQVMENNFNIFSKADF